MHGVSKAAFTPGHNVAEHKLYPLVAVVFLVSATKSLHVCLPSVAG